MAEWNRKPIRLGQGWHGAGRPVLATEASTE